MVESIKHPKVVLDSQIKYVTVHSTPPPEVDFSDDLYTTQTEDKDQLKWLVAGSVGGGTINPDDSNFCLYSAVLLWASIMNNFNLFRAVMNWKNFGFDSDQFKKSLEGLAKSETIILGASGFAETIVLSKVQPPTDLKSFFLLLSNKRYFPVKISAILHLEVWTPYGIVKGIPRTWNACGRPGGGLGKKLAEKGKKLFNKPVRPVLVPVSNYAPVVDPKAATEALTATALLGIVGVAILSILTLPESVAASVVLPVIQSEKKDHSM